MTGAAGGEGAEPSVPGPDGPGTPDARGRGEGAIGADAPTGGGAGPAGPRLPLDGGLGRAVRAGLDGQALSRRGVLAAIGGWRGVAETLLPGLLFLVTYTITRDARLSAIAPAALAVVAVVVRLVRREPATSAFSGAAGVAIAVAATLLTGRGEDYYLPGFWTNGLWAAALLGSLAVRWPLLGLVLGALRGDLRGWRAVRPLRRAATALTLLWLAMFAARLAVQLPLYLAARGGDEAATDALGVARLVMGVPLFAIVIVFTWLVASRLGRTADPESSDETAGDGVGRTGRNAPSA